MFVFYLPKLEMARRLITRNNRAKALTKSTHVRQVTRAVRAQRHFTAGWWPVVALAKRPLNISEKPGSVAGRGSAAPAG